MRWIDALKPFANEVLDLLLPRYCVVCGQRIKSNEQSICVGCLQGLPAVPQTDVRDNYTVRLFLGKVNIDKGFSLFFYQRDTASQHIFSQMKYQGRDDLCRDMGRLLAYMARSKDFFEGIDVIVPVPLHRTHQSERGYNQAQQIALGISKVTGIPLDNQVVERIRNTKSQVTMNQLMRRENIKGAFRADPERVRKYQHILVVDDTITTGSTVLEVLTELQKASPKCLFSVCSIGLVHFQ